MKPIEGTTRRIVIVLGPFLSGILPVLTFPRYDLSWLAWICLVPLFISLSNSNGPKQWFLLCFLCGLIFFPGIFNWILEIPGYRLTHHAILGLYLSLYFGLFGLAFSFIAKRRGAVMALFAAPFLWITHEYVRSNLGFMALPWALIGHTQYNNLQLIQVSSFTGIYGVSFLIVLANAAITAVILAFFLRSEREGILTYAIATRREALFLIVTAASLTALTLLFGKIAISQPIVGESIKLSVIQGNIEQSKKWDRRYAEYTMKTYADLSREASKDQPSIIAWPEAATPGFVLKNLSHLKMLKSLIRETKTYYLIGSAEYPKFKKAGLDSEKIGNTALFFSPEGRVLGQHLKIWLVPFREYVPFEGTIPWPDFIVPEKKRSFGNQGKKFTIFEFDEAKFGVVICWESLFPGLFRKFVKKGAGFIVNITNEAAFGDQEFPYQFLAINVFRAVENKIAVARAANTGISCFIGPYGRITGKIEKNNSDIFVRGYFTQEVPVSQEKTFYTIYGDIFAYVSLITTILLMVLSFSGSKK